MNEMNPLQGYTSIHNNSHNSHDLEGCLCLIGHFYRLCYMNSATVTQLLTETLQIAEEESLVADYESFKSFVLEMLPAEVINQLEEILGSDDFLKEIWEDKYEITEVQEEAEQLAPGLCMVCERHMKLTRHHVFPRETHKKLVKKGYDNSKINLTIPICRMCHSTIHRFFTNDQLSESYYTVDLLLADEKFYKYARWAALQRTAHKTKK